MPGTDLRAAAMASEAVTFAVFSSVTCSARLSSCPVPRDVVDVPADVVSSSPPETATAVAVPPPIRATAAMVAITMLRFMRDPPRDDSRPTGHPVRFDEDHSGRPMLKPR